MYLYALCVCVCLYCPSGYCYLDFIDGNIELRNLMTYLRSFKDGETWI